LRGGDSLGLVLKHHKHVLLVLLLLQLVLVLDVVGEVVIEVWMRGNDLLLVRCKIKTLRSYLKLLLRHHHLIRILLENHLRAQRIVFGLSFYGKVLRFCWLWSNLRNRSVIFRRRRNDESYLWWSC
jgi:hypothetical protein